LSLLTVGSVSIFCSVNSRSVWRAVLASYGVVYLMATFLIGLPASIYVSFGPVRGTLLIGAGGALFSGLFLWAATSQLRYVQAETLSENPGLFRERRPKRKRVVAPPRTPSPGTAEPKEAVTTEAEPAEVAQDAILVSEETGRDPLPWSRDRRPPLPPIGNWPVLWKEVYGGVHRLHANRALEIGLLAGGFMVLAPLFVLSVDEYRLVRGLNLFVAVMTVLLGLWLLLGVSFRAAGSVSREREGRTWDSLLLLPVQRTTLLWSKGLGSVLRMRVPMFGLLIAWLLGAVTGALNPVGLAALVVAFAAHLAFLVGVGLWLSLVCRTTLWSTFAMAVVLLVMLTGSLLLTQASGAAGDTLMERVQEVGLSPPFAWWHVCISWSDWMNATGRQMEKLVTDFTAALAGIGIYAVGAVLAWWVACRRVCHV
jgi:ABC-type transport system involved in multi-copper enzyme maturation permease subunit